MLRKDCFRIAFVSDPHCSHIAGLTPPDWWVSTGRSKAWAELQRRGWKKYIDWRKKMGQPDAVFLMGDLIDGRQAKQGGAELLTADVGEQCEIAAHVCSILDPKDGYAMVYGTPYHCGQLTDDENSIADKLSIPKSRRGNRLAIDVRGVLFDLAHKIGGSQTPTGGDAALRAEAVHTMQWNAVHGIPIPQQIVRGHVHRYRAHRDSFPHVTTLPAMQLWTKFGASQCRALYDYGRVYCDVTPKGEVIWTVEKERLVDWQSAQTVHMG